RLLKAEDAGRAELLIGSPADAPSAHDEIAAGASLPAGARFAIDVVRTTDALRPALAHALRGVVICADLETARDLVRAYPRVRAVTPDGDVLGAYAAAGGSAKATSFIEIQAAVDEARQRRTAAETRLATLQVQLTAARAEVVAREQAVEVAV